MRPGADTVRREVVSEPVGLLLQLGVGDLVVSTGDGETVRKEIDRMLEQIRDVVGHAEKLEPVTVSGNPGVLRSR